MYQINQELVVQICIVYIVATSFIKLLAHNWKLSSFASVPPAVQGWEVIECARGLKEFKSVTADADLQMQQHRNKHALIEVIKVRLVNLHAVTNRHFMYKSVHLKITDYFSVHMKIYTELYDYSSHKLKARQKCSTIFKLKDLTRWKHKFGKQRRERWVRLALYLLSRSKSHQMQITTLYTIHKYTVLWSVFYQRQISAYQRWSDRPVASFRQQMQVFSPTPWEFFQLYCRRSTSLQLPFFEPTNWAGCSYDYEKH